MEESVAGQKQRNSLLNSFFSVLSTVFHPLAVCVICLFFLLFSNSLLGEMISWQSRLVVLARLTVVYLVLPGFLWRVSVRAVGRGGVSGMEKILPSALVTLAFLLALLVIPKGIVYLILRNFMVGVFAVALLRLAVSLIYDLDPYGMAFGAAIALMVVKTLSGYTALLWPLVSIIVLSGLTLTGRLYMGKGRLENILVGVASGFGVMFSVLYFL